VSYGIYLWHLPIIKGLHSEVHGAGRSSAFYVGALVAVMALSTAWAAISYHFVEKRFITEVPPSRAGGQNLTDARVPFAALPPR